MVIGVGILSNTLGALIFRRISVDAPVDYRKGRSFAAALVWAMVRADLPYPVYFVLGFVTFLGVRMRFMLNYALLLQTIPRDDRVSYTSMHNLVSGGIAIATGLLGGWLADQGWLMGTEGPAGPIAFAHHPYAATYLVAAAASLAALLVACRLPSREEEKASLTAREQAL